MTRTQREWCQWSGLSENDYAAHLEDALIQACQKIDKNEYMLCFWEYLQSAKLDPNTGESEEILTECPQCYSPLDRGFCHNCAWHYKH